MKDKKNEKPSKPTKIMVNILSVVSIMIAIAAVVAVIITPKGKVPSLFGISVLKIASGSMDPNIPSGSLAIIKLSSSNEVNITDVISFYSSDPQKLGEINTNRVVDILESGEIVTKGDANRQNDHYTVTPSNIIGKVVFSSALFGYLIDIIQNKYVFIAIILLPFGLILFASIRRVFLLAKEEVKTSVLEDTLRYEQEQEDVEKSKDKADENAAEINDENDDE